MVTPGEICIGTDFQLQIYEQIKFAIKSSIMSGQLTENKRIPSIRDFVP